MQIYTVRPSKQLAVFVVVLHGLAAVALVLADLSWVWRGVGLAAILLSLGYHLRRRDSARLGCADDGGLALWDGDWIDTKLLPDTLVTPWVTVVRLKVDGKRCSQSIPVLTDSLPPDDFRRLRVWLKWRAKLEAKADGTPDG